MSNKFMFTPEETAILKNFAGIHPSMVISPHGLYVRNTAGNTVGIHRFKEPYTFERFGIYEVPTLLSILNVYKTPEITVNPKFLEIRDSNGSKVRYFTTAIELSHYFQTIKGETIEPYLDDVKRYRIENNFEKVKCDLEFVLTAEHINMILKMSSLINNANTIFFESIGNLVKVTVGEKLEASFDSWELEIKENITTNCLSAPVCVKVADLRLIPSDYVVKISNAGISKWESPMVDYYMGIYAVSTK